MTSKRVWMDDRRRAAALATLCAGALAAGPAYGGGLMLYEVGTADVGLASAGYGAPRTPRPCSPTPPA
jgi:hypothetical protein